MSHTIGQLRAATDDELIARHDAAAESTVVGVSYYLDELRRREMARAMAASNRLAKVGLLLAAANAMVAVVAVVIAVAL